MRVGITFSSFDLLHAGHVVMLKEAKKQCDYLIVGLEKEITFGFSFKNQFISAYDSFLTQSPSVYQLQALTETTILSLTYDDLQSVYKSTQIGNLIGRLTAEDLFLIKSNREQNLLNLTAEQRYLKLFKERPELLESIPLKYISSYIGVTAQALSRIRKRLIHTLY